jgi:hypothetical protein
MIGLVVRHDRTGVHRGNGALAQPIASYNINDIRAKRPLNDRRGSDIEQISA